MWSDAPAIGRDARGAMASRTTIPAAWTTTWSGFPSSRPRTAGEARWAGPRGLYLQPPRAEQLALQRPRGPNERRPRQRVTFLRRVDPDQLHLEDERGPGRDHPPRTAV